MGKIPYLAVLLLFVVCYCVTSPEYIGDTTRYAADAINHAEGHASQFWEFGHLLWRPWGYAGYRLTGPWHAQHFGDTPLQAATRFLVCTNFVCAAGSLVLFLFLLRKISPTWIATGVVAAISCAASFLNYSHSGAPYIPALLFSALAICLLTNALEQREGRQYAVLAGASFAVACALWFPYSTTGLGMLLAIYFWPSKKDRAARHGLMRGFLAALGGVTLILFTAGAAAEGIQDLNDFARWVREADNGWSQSLTAMRAITGLPRCFWDFGHDGILLKRWLFSDPYNPAHISAVALSMGWKLLVFYAGLGAAMWVLWKERRTILWIFVGAGVPLLFFAVVIFEPSSAERFLPAFPFASVAFAAALHASGRAAWARICVAALLSSALIVNVAHSGWGRSDARMREAKTRLQALHRNVRPGTLVFLLTFNDDLCRLPAAHPLDRGLASSRFTITDVIEIASRRISGWKTEFAQRAQAQWARNTEVWVSERLLAARPDARWLWVEGDDRRIQWSELPRTFSEFEFDAKILSGQDGFLRLPPSPANRDRLVRIAR